jgi:hypothetical protein
VKYTYFLLIFLKFGKSDIKVFIHMLISKEFNGSLIHFPCMGKISMLFFEAGIFDPVLHIRMYKDEWRGIKEIPGKTWLEKNIANGG